MRFVDPPLYLAINATVYGLCGIDPTGNKIVLLPLMVLIPRHIDFGVGPPPKPVVFESVQSVHAAFRPLPLSSGSTPEA